MDKNQQAFFALVRAGLWEKEIQLLPYGDVDFEQILQIAEEQSVVGLVAAGLEYVTDMKPVKKDVLQFIGRTMQLEQRNQAMNYFIGVMVDKMREAGIYTTLVKGQGVAQCYVRPLWRACGDVDFFLDKENYYKAKAYLAPLVTSVEPEGMNHLHYCATIDPWVVELHGTLHCGLSARMDRVIDSIQQDTFAGGNVRTWKNGETEVLMPGVDNDVVFIFTHFLKHFYKGGLGLRQICDWCRLLWTFREIVDATHLEKRLREMGLMSEWKAFGAYAVEYLGILVEAMPLYSPNAKWQRKAGLIQKFILRSGNFGHNRDVSYFSKHLYFIRKTISLCQRVGDSFSHALIFPIDSIRFFPSILFNGLRSAVNGE